MQGQMKFVGVNEDEARLLFKHLDREGTNFIPAPGDALASVYILVLCHGVFNCSTYAYLYEEIAATGEQQ